MMSLALVLSLSVYLTTNLNPRRRDYRLQVPTFTYYTAKTDQYKQLVKQINEIKTL